MIFHNRGNSGGSFLVNDRISRFGRNNEKIRKILHSKPKIMLLMVRMNEINSKITEKLRPDSDV